MKRHQFRCPNKNSAKSLVNFPVETIKDEENPFTQIGLLSLIVEDIINLKKEMKSIQRTDKLMRRVFRNSVREEIHRENF
jgi:hypothetical protein